MGSYATDMDVWFCALPLQSCTPGQQLGVVDVSDMWKAPMMWKYNGSNAIDLHLELRPILRTAALTLPIKILNIPCLTAL